MNWLAHLYLSEGDARFRVGNLLPDLASASQLAHLPEPFQRGIRQHRQIDVFTDTHPTVQACVRRFPSPYRRFGSILTDVYFDYFLARDWPRYSPVPLHHFLSEFYQDIETCVPELPDQSAHRLCLIRDENWLASYHTIEGISGILSRIGQRFRQPCDLSASLSAFQEYELDFLADFHAFFPELMAHVHQRIQ